MHFFIVYFLAKIKNLALKLRTQLATGHWIVIDWVHIFYKNLDFASLSVECEKLKDQVKDHERRFYLVIFNAQSMEKSQPNEHI
jgi:sulfur relay (sulfurtransferase) DsrC/TusE family protein